MVCILAELFYIVIYKASMWHKAELMGRPMGLELTRVGLLV